MLLPIPTYATDYTFMSVGHKRVVRGNCLVDTIRMNGVLRSLKNCI